LQRYLGRAGAPWGSRRIPFTYAVEELGDLPIVDVGEQEIVRHEVGDHRVLTPLLAGTGVLRVALPSHRRSSSSFSRSIGLPPSGSGRIVAPRGPVVLVGERGGIDGRAWQSRMRVEDG
jgi:hypothetical protein